MHQQERDLLELARVGDLENVIATVMQVIARHPDRAQCRIAGRNSGERDGLLGFGCDRGCFRHGVNLFV